MSILTLFSVATSYALTVALVLLFEAHPVYDSFGDVVLSPYSRGSANQRNAGLVTLCVLVGAVPCYVFLTAVMTSARDNRVRRTVWNASKLLPLLAATFLPMLYLIIVVA